MFSILIPTYNFVCTKLVEDLNRQAESLNVPYEIFVADDASTDAETITANEAINKLPQCTFYKEKVNLGRARIRNRLADRAQYGYLLFIDSDAQVVAPDFLQKYLNEARRNTSVICGGVRNVPSCPSRKYILRYKYEKAADRHRSADEREQNPYAHFTTFNVMIRKDVFEQIRFDETCTEYGYEDVLFGVDLRSRCVLVYNIDNVLVHNGLDTNADFLQKTEAALRSLHKMDKRVKREAHVSHLAHRLDIMHIGGLLRLHHMLWGWLERLNLLSSCPFLWVLSLYKLGYYSTLEKKDKKE